TGAVVVAVGTPDARTQFAYQDRMLRTSLPAVLRSRYEKGYADVERELEELTGSIETAQSSAEEQRMATKAKVDADLLKDQQEIKLKQQDAEKSRKKWDEWIGDQTAKADDLLREQEKKYQDLDRSVNTQIQSITALRMMLLTNNNTVVTNLQQPQVVQPQGQGQGQQGRRRNNQAPITTLTPPNPQSVELQLMVEERRLAGLYDQQAGVANDAARTVAARRQAVAKYQQATGVAMKETANLDRWEKRNQSIAENQKKAAEKKPVQVATLEARIKSWNTWDPGDFETEKRRLLADLGVVAAGK
ncbi:MAG TPA: hypothetical protein VM452_06180, partial [Caulifigura sp.]|nr:hypothetical protein [Caulifigura sp.]